MDNLNKYINQYLNHSYTIKEGYILTDDYLSINSIAQDISLYYDITYEQAIQYILKWLKKTFGEYTIKYKNSLGYWWVRTYDQYGNLLTYKDSHGSWYECTYDENGNVLTYKDSNGDWSERTYDENGNKLTYKRSSGYCSEWTYDENGNELTHKDGWVK